MGLLCPTLATQPNHSRLDKINLVKYKQSNMVKKPTVKEHRLLGRERAVGLCWQGEGLIEIDPRLSSKSALDTFIHEMLHHYAPEWSEAKVTRTATSMAQILWKHRFRRVEK